MQEFVKIHLNIWIWELNLEIYMWLMIQRKANMTFPASMHGQISEWMSREGLFWLAVGGQVSGVYHSANLWRLKQWLYKMIFKMWYDQKHNYCTALK